MRGLVAAALILGVAASAEGRTVAGRRFGVGLVVGELEGISGYASLGGVVAVDLALGVIGWDSRRRAAHADVLLVFAEIGRGGDLSTPIHVGAGLFVIDHYDNAFVGLRVPFGLALVVRPARLQLFGEVALKQLLARAYETARDTEIEAALGLRFFF
jgi:hypothetical protein